MVADQHIDLLVLGTHGRHGLQKLVLGSVAEELLRQVFCPVLTVGPKASGRIKEEFDETGKDFRLAEIDLQQIIFAVDLSPESLAAAPFAVSLAEEFEARLGLLYVIEEPAATPSRWAIEYVGSLVPQEAALWCRPETIVKIGSPAEQILETAKEKNADLIVLGVHSANEGVVAATHLPGSVASRVIAGATCPVLTVRK
jgi:nucleotide-binding universal stress UspA family protein